MIRRLIGLILLVTLFFPPVAAASGYFILRDTVSQFWTVIDDRIERVQNKLDDVEEAIRDVQDQLAPLAAPINAVIGSLNTLIDDLNDLNLGSLTIPGINLPDFELNLGFGRFTIVIPNIPSVNLTIPGLSSLGGLFEDTLQSIETLASAISAVLNLRVIPEILSDAAAEVQALATDFGGILAHQASATLGLALACGLWLVLVYIVSLYLGIGTGWRMVTGR